MADPDRLRWCGGWVAVGDGPQDRDEEFAGPHGCAI